MDRWEVTVTFEGHVEADSPIAAAKAFKSALGLAPESMRPDASMTALGVRKLGEPYGEIVVGRNLQDAAVERLVQQDAEIMQAGDPC